MGNVRLLSEGKAGGNVPDPITSRFGAQQIAVERPDNVETITDAEWQSMQEKVLHELRRIGIGWGRYLSRWDVMRPVIDRTDGYDFAASDFATGAASRAGIALVGQLTNRRGPIDLTRVFYPGYEPLMDRTAFMEYVRITVERYDGDSDFGLPEGHAAFPDCDLDRDGKITDDEKAKWGKSHQIHCWELVKEPVPPAQSLPQRPGIPAGQVVEILEAGWTAIKQADPDALVLFGGLAPVPVGGIEALKKYFNEILSAGGGQYFDVIGIDAFTHPVEEIMEIHREILKSHGLNKQIWVVQIGTNAVGQGRFAQEGGTLAKQDAFVVKGFVRSFAAGAEKVFWGDFMYRTDEADPRDVWHDYGLLHYDAVHKRPGFYTYALLISKLEGFTSVRKVNEGHYLFQFADKPPVFALWKEKGEETVDLSAHFKTTEVVITHIIDEKDKTTPRVERFPATAVPITEKPVFVEASGPS